MARLAGDPACLRTMAVGVLGAKPNNTADSIGTSVTVPAARPSPIRRAGSMTLTVTGLPLESVVVYTIAVADETDAGGDVTAPAIVEVVLIVVDFGRF